MKVIFITNEIKNSIISKNDNITNLTPITLTDNRICISADILNDMNYNKYMEDISNLNIEDINDLLIPEKKLIYLLEKDQNGPLMPENYNYWYNYYKNIYIF